MEIRTVISRYFLPGSFQSEEFNAISSWLIRLRWAAVCGFFFLTIGLSVWAPTLFPNHLLYGVCLIISIYNAAFFILAKIKTNMTPAVSHGLIRLPIVLDWVALLVLIHLTGGIFSPLIFFFILHIIINTMIFPPALCFIYTTASLTGMGLLFVFEHYLFPFQTKTSWFGISYQQLNVPTILLALGIYTFVLYAATFLAASIMVRFRQREKVVRCLSDRLQESLTRMETLYQTTRSMASSAHSTSILDVIVRESTRIMKVKGAVLRLVQGERDELLAFASFGLSDHYVHKGPVLRDRGLFPKKADDVIMVEDVASDPRIMYPRQAVAEGIKSIISIPMAHKGRVTGDLRLYASTCRHFSENEVSFLKIMTGDAAIILDNMRTREELQDTNKKIKLFANRLSHDLRAPVAAVQALLETMKNGYAGPLSARQQSLLQRCNKKVQHLLIIIRDILHLAEGKVSLEQHTRVDIRLDEVAADAFRLVEPLFAQKNITFAYAPAPPIMFQEISGDFQRLFSNLLENAARYTPEGGRVDLRLLNSSDHIIMKLQDTGIGIDAGDLEKIFDEFYRSPTAKQMVYEGTGLGLPVVKSIVKRYNGYINVSSTPGKGTTFTITLPKV